MKIVFLFFSTMVSLLAFGQKPAGSSFSIYASFKKGDTTLSKVVIGRSGLARYKVDLDTLYTKEGQLSYKAKFIEPEFIQLTFFFSTKQAKTVAFWTFPQRYKIQFDKELRPQILSKNTNEFEIQVEQLIQEVTKHNKILDEKLKDVSYKNKAISAVELEIQHLKDSIRVIIDNKIDSSYQRRIINYPNKPISLYALIQYAERPYEKQRVKNIPDEIMAMLKKLSLEIVTLPSAELLYNKLNIGKQLAVGSIFRDVEMADTIGAIHRISSYKGKYVLVDFWASWCVPCREEFPYLLKAYEKYKDKGFHIIGISLDTRENQWKEAIRKDGIGKWTQLIDRNQIGREKYAIRFIPENYLLDPKGMIIAKNLRGEDLLKLLETL